jgi:hypothetical protein
MSDIKSIIQLMVDNNEPQEKIEEVINLYNSNKDVVKPIDDFSFDYKIIDDPKSGEDVVRSLASIEKSTNVSEDSDLRKFVLDKVFDFDYKEAVPDQPYQFPAGSTSYHPEFNPIVSDNTSTLGMTSMQPVIESIQNKDEERKNEYLLETFGKEKFDLYQEFLQTGDLDLKKVQELEKEFEKNNKEAKFNPYSNILAHIQQEEEQNKKSFSKTKKEEYLKNNKKLVDQSFFSAIEIDDDIQELYSLDFIEKYKDIETYAKEYTVDATPGSGGVSEMGYVTNLSEKGKVETKKAIAEKAITAQSEYLTKVNNVLNEDIKGYNDYLKSIKINNSEELEAYLNNEEIDIEQRRNVLNKSREINNDIKKYQAQAIRFNDMNAALEALDKSYSNGYRFVLALENAIFADMGLLVKGIGAMTVDKIAPESKAASFMKDAYRSHINYAESVKQKQEAQLPVTVKVKDVGFNNIGRFIAEQAAENGFSIATALTYGGVVKRLASKPAQKYAKKALQTTFFTVEGGGGLSQMEIMQKNAAENIKMLQAKLDEDDAIPGTRAGIPEDGVLRFKMSDDERLEIQKEIEANERALNYTQGQRAFNALGYGTVATVAETFGTMKFFDDFAKLDKLKLGNLSMRSVIKGTGQFIKKGPVTELVEETLTQVGHNFLDNIILKDNKSLVEGVDADFLASVLVSSLAIGGPTVSSGVRNAVRNTFQTRKQTKEFQDLAVEYIENQYILNEGTNLSKGGINKKQADFLKARQLEILEKAGIKDIQNYLEVTNLDGNKIKELFEISRKQGALYNQAVNLGVTGLDEASIKKDRDRINKEYNDLQSQKEAILGEPANQRNKKLKQTAKENGLEESDAIKASFNAGRAAYYDALVNSLDGNIVKFDGETRKQTEAELNKWLDDAIKSGKLKDKKLKNGTVVTAEQQKQAIIKGFRQGGNGTFVGSDILTFEDNRRINMLRGNDIERADAEQVAIHELQHMFDINTGLVKDGKVVSSHKPLATALKQHVESLYKDGDISKKIYDQFKQRVAQYSDKVNKNKVVDQTELLTLIGTMKRAGMLKKEKSSLLYSLKSFINKVRRGKHGDNYTLLDMKTTKDMLRYIDTFNNRVDQGKAMAQLPPEEEVVSKQSKEASDNVQRIYEKEGVAGAMDIIEQFKPITSKIVEKRREAPNFDRELLTSEIEIGERGIFDLIREYKPESGVPLAAYINKFLPARAIEASRRVLGEEFTEDVSEKVNIVAEEVTTEVKTKPKKKKIVLADRLGVTEEVAQAIKKIMPKIDFNRKTFKTLKNQIPEITGGLFGISPKKIKNLANLTKKELQSAQMFINKNADLLINMLPEGATTGGTATGVPQTLLKAFYTKSDRAKMVKTGSKAGLAIQQKNKIDKKQFLETFGFVDGKPIRTDRNTSARVLALANLTGKMITNQAVRQSLISGGKTVGELTSLSDGKSVTMFSLGSRIKITGPISEQAQKLADKIGKKATYENMVKAAGIDIDTGELKLKPIDLTTEEGRQEYIGFIAEVLAPIFPKDVLLAMSGSFARGDSAIEKANKNKFLFQNKEQFEIFLETLEATGIVFGENMTVENQNDILNAIKRESYGKATSKTQSKKMKDKELKASKKIGFKLIWETIQDNIQEDQRTIPGFALMLSSSSRFQGHFTRTGAVIDFVNSLTGKNREEHTSPITALGKYLFLHAITGDLFTGGKNSIFENATKSYFQGSLPVFMDNRLKLKGVYDYSSLPPIEHLEGILKGDISIWARYFHPNVNNNFTTDFDSMSAQDIANGEHLIGGINPNVIELANGNTIAKEFGVDVNVKITPQIAAAQQDLIYRMAVGEKISKSKIKSVLNAAVNLKIKKQLKQNKTLNKAIVNSRKTVKQSKGITVLDFDDTLATTESLVKYTTPDGKTGTLNAEQFASTYEDLQDQGYTFDFSDFNKVVKGKLAPLFQKALKLQKKFGPENMFVLTARPPAAQKAIFDFLKANGLNIPLKNITGLGNSTAEAKALWIADKVGEGYNDFYFADDALQNVQAVDDVLSQLGVKRKVQQAKIKFSKGLNRDLFKNKNYKKFRNSLKGSVLYHGGTASLSDNKAVWFIASDFDGAELYADRRDGKVYSINSNSLNNAIIIPDVSDLIGLEKVIKNKYKSIAKEVFDEYGRVDIKKVLETDVASEVISDFMDYVNNNFELLDGVYGPETLYDNDGKISKGVPVIVLGGNVSTKVSKVKFSKSIQTIPAVANMLEQFDVKSKVQQAKVKFSKGMSVDFNKILEDVTGIEANKRFSDMKARKRGKKKGKFRFFIPPSHEDFVGLLYNFMGKGRQGDAHRDFFEKALVRPLNRAYKELDTAKQAIANDYKALNKQFPEIKKKLRKDIPDGDFIFEDAIRVYLWNKHGYDIPGLSKTDQASLVELVMNDPQLISYAEAVNVISKQDTYVNPDQGWDGGNIKTDLIDATGRVGRAQFFEEFKENADLIFSPENLNKIEAAYGKDFRSALEDILHRIGTGINRPKGQHATVNKFMNYLNGSVGTVMFFNVRSAILQQMSIVNYINFADNNIFAAAKAFANQKQYWEDFAFIFNSDMLKQRRGGIGTDINGNDLAQAVAGSKNPSKVVISKLLQLGFLPTQIGDNIAIATGGATFYRNRINKYIKDGLSKKEAEAKAFTDFQDLTQSTQQSSRPDMTSQQQASWIGKLVLNFQNITSQYNRIIKKAALDIKNGRISPPYTTRTQSNLGNLSKILYYGAIQNAVFYSLQTALFAVMFGDDEDEDQILKKRERVINGSIDSILRGSGIYGAVLSTLKNTLIKFKEQREKGYNKDESAVALELANFSPVLGIKLRQIVNAEKTLNYNENIISEMETFDAENPMWSAVTNYTQALTNFPANRLYQKTLNMRNALDKDYTNFQRVMFFSGYTTWSLGLGDSEAIIEAKEKAKINKKNKRKSTTTTPKSRAVERRAVTR